MLCDQLRAAGFSDAFIVEGAVSAAVAAAISSFEMIFGRQDHQALFVEIEVDAFLQLFHLDC